MDVWCDRVVVFEVAMLFSVAIVLLLMVWGGKQGVAGCSWFWFAMMKVFKVCCVLFCFGGRLFLFLGVDWFEIALSLVALLMLLLMFVVCG
jgi:hypothetical protein